MKKILSISLACSCMFAFSLAKEVDYGYNGKNSPNNWSNISKKYEECKIGGEESPINITGHIFETSNPLSITFDYSKEQPTKEFFTGTTIEVNYNKGNTVKVGDDTYYLTQLHFHSPAENKINSKEYPMELHFVNTDSKNHILVIAVMFKTGKENKALQDILDSMSKTKDTQPKNLNLAMLLPQKMENYYFDGSLTTPPCTEGVSWIVFKQPIEASDKQIQEFKQFITIPNNRPLQPLNKRIIIEQDY